MCISPLTCFQKFCCLVAVKSPKALWAPGSPWAEWRRFFTLCWKKQYDALGWQNCQNGWTFLQLVKVIKKESIFSLLGCTTVPQNEKQSENLWKMYLPYYYYFLSVCLNAHNHFFILQCFVFCCLPLICVLCVSTIFIIQS